MAGAGAAGAGAAGVVAGALAAGVEGARAAADEAAAGLGPLAWSIAAQIPAWRLLTFAGRQTRKSFSWML